MSCRFVSSDQPRAIIGRHILGVCAEDGCKGCLPCLEWHCMTCGRNHARVTCTDCLEAARSDLKAIWDLCASLPLEAAEKGIQSQAAMLWGPAADPEAWRNRATAAMVGRVDASYLEDCRDELHPLWILGSWEQIWRDHLDHYTEARLTLEGAYRYLDMQLGYMATLVEPAFDEFARELRECRAHLEDVLTEGDRPQYGAPCVQCKTPMLRVVTDRGAQDIYHCRTCRRDVSGDQYRYAVGVTYQFHAPALTAEALGQRLGIKPSVIRVWGSRGQIRKQGRTPEGLILYNVEDAECRRDAVG